MKNLTESPLANIAGINRTVPANDNTRQKDNYMNMIEYIKALSPLERAGIVAGAFVGVLAVFALFWAMAIGCVALGGSVEVCGL